MTQAQAEVQGIFAEVTRYPLDVLDPNAHLEEDLGIDSVKLGEVFSVLRERFSLPAELGVPREQLTSIAAVTAAIASVTGTGASATTASPVVAPVAAPIPAPVTVAPPAAVVPASGTAATGAALLSGETESQLIALVAEVTRYPVDVLDPVADLEEDLGIDSVKLGEVFSVVRERYGVPTTLDTPRSEMRTLRDVARVLQPYMRQPGERTDTLASVATRPSTAASPATRTVAAALPHRPFEGKVLFVSGSGRGLGRDIATYLADLGASVVVNSFHSRPQGEQTAQDIRDRGGDALHLWGSMANPEHVDRIFDEIEARYHGLDFLVANASNGMLARLKDITAKDWEKAYRTNVVGLHQCALRAVPLMRTRGGGKIITLSSPAAHGYVDYFGCMGTVKAAVESLTKSMAIEFAPDNIQVNCVSPGPIYGELLQKWPESERLIRQWEDNTAYSRLCESRDVSHFIAYLLSEPVKLFTGSVLVLDGGISSQGW